MNKPSILVNLKRCTGCWTCSLACKVGNNLGVEEYWQFVRTNGDGSGIDEPAGVWPDVSMSWMPIYTTNCRLCGSRIAEGLEPFCTYNCPSQAMTFGDLDDSESPVSVKMDELKRMGYKIFQLPSWEGTRREIYYAEK